MFYKKSLAYFKTITLVKKLSLTIMLAFIATSGLSTAVSAYTYTRGTTWFSDGTSQKSGATGTTIRAYAVQAIPNIPYKLVSGKNGCTTDITNINPNTVYAGSSGFIGTVIGTIDRPAGNYDVCFYSQGPSVTYTTSSATFTVTKPPAIIGSTWYNNGTRAMDGPAGTQVTAYARGALENVPYQLVSGKNGCSTDIILINPTVIYANSTGYIPPVTGTVNRTSGTYDVCFSSVNAGIPEVTATAPVTFTVK